MAFTIEQLFGQGAHHTVERLIIRGEATFADVSRALTRRFGNEIAQSGSAVAELREQTINAVNKALELEGLQLGQTSPYGRNPLLPQAFRYTVIAEIPDPFEEGKNVSIPWTINSDKPMTGEEILAEAGKQLAAGIVVPEYFVGARFADVTRRFIRFNEAVKESKFGPGDFTLTILGAYSRD